jgi:hypothetical protein
VIATVVESLTHINYFHSVLLDRREDAKKKRQPLLLLSPPLQRLIIRGKNTHLNAVSVTERVSSLLPSCSTNR